MSKHNATIYGPPSHRLDRFTIYLEQQEGVWSLTDVVGGSSTAKGQLWRLRDVYEGEADDANHANTSLALYCLAHDLMRDQPGTQERAQFVASGGLYEQLSMF